MTRAEAYARLAAFRRRLSFGDERPVSYAFTAEIYFRALGVIYVFAFLSAAVQMKGLVGREGCLPAARTFAAIASRVGWERLLYLPTLAWLSASDALLLGQAVAGLLAGVALAAGFFPRLAAIAAWGLYLSVVNAGDIFYGYQWEALLLEAGFLAALTAPFRRYGQAPIALAGWLHRALLFRLMVSSAAVKWLSGDENWRALTALDYHFETQPLPTPLAWYAHNLPRVALKGMTLGTFIVEGLVPFLFFLPRPWRVGACVLQIALQLFIAATGNYTYFNLLTIALCLWLLDDAVFRRPFVAAARASRPALAVGAALFFLGAVELLGTLRASPDWAERLASVPERFRVVSGYGLFAVMTTERDELEIEGSRDGKDWRAYPLAWKPGDPRRAPRWVAPHQPRLEWQAWFASLGEFPRQYWLHGCLAGILAGRAPVLGLFGRNPFPEGPPKYVRVKRYRYKFTDWAHRDAWWTREPLEDYSPVIEAP